MLSVSTAMRIPLQLLLIALSCVHDGAAAESPSSPKLFITESIDETGFSQSLDYTHILHDEQSPYQHIQVLQGNPVYGKILVLDGVTQLTQGDASHYNEMMAHPALFSHVFPPQRVLLIGGGDGAVLYEILKHNTVVHVDHVDLDAAVVRAAQEHFAWGDAWKDDRVHLHIADGAQFVQEAASGSYDVVIQDSSDPWTWQNGQPVELPSNVLYQPTHLGHLHRILTKQGVLSLQAETLQIPSDLQGIQLWRQSLLDSGFVRARYGNIMISSYPTGQIGFLLAEKSRESCRQTAERYQGMTTRYYHPRLQTSAFDLPLWAEQAIYGNGGYKSVCEEDSDEYVAPE